MKVVKIILGVLAGVATVAYLVQFIGVVSRGDLSTRGTTETAAALSALCIGGAVTLALFKSALKKPGSK